MKSLSKYLAAFVFALSGTFCVHAEAATDKKAIPLPSVMVLPQEGAFTVSPNGVSVVSDSWRTVFAFMFKTDSVFNKVTLVGASWIPNGTALFLWKAKNQPFSDASQVPVSVRNWSFELPDTLQSKNFDFFGLVVWSNSLSFVDVMPATVTLGDRFSALFEPELVKPSTINLLYWHKWGNTPLVAILWFLTIALGLTLVIIGKPKYALGTVLALWIAYDLLLARDQYLVMEKTSETFLAPADSQDRTYFDFGNLYAFTDATRDCLAGQEGGVNLYAPSEWPFWHNVSYHLIPRRVTYQTKDKPFYAAFAWGEFKDGKFYYRWTLVDENVMLVCSVRWGSLILKKTK